MIRVIFILLLFITNIAYSHKPIKKGKAYTYSYKIKDDPLTYIATTQRGFTINTLEELNSLIEKQQKTASLFYIRVYSDHIIVTRPDIPDFKETVPRKNVVSIHWVK